MKILFLFLFLISPNFFAQPNIEVFVMDSYVTPDIPYVLNISFFSTDSAKSKLVIDDRYEIIVSEKFQLDHEFSRNLDEFQFDSLTIPFYIIAQNKYGESIKSEYYSFDLPAVNLIQNSDSPGMFDICLGGVIYLLPSVGVLYDQDPHLFISKEVPLVTLYSVRSDYPTGVFSVEFSHIVNYDKKNLVSLGYKHFFEPEFIEFISVGLNGFSNFKGFNGISPEVTAGIYNFNNSFTLYGRFRSSLGLGNDKRTMNEVSIGLFTTFISFTF